MPVVRSSSVELVCQVQSSHDLAPLQASVRRFLRALGLPSREQWCVAIAASEAASNLVKHAGGGTLSLRLDGGPPPALVLEALDCGPGFADIDRALLDHVSEGVDLVTDEPRRHRRGLGTGLGAIGRMMGTLAVENRPGGGARVVAIKQLSRSCSPAGTDSASTSRQGVLWRRAT